MESSYRVLVFTQLKAILGRRLGNLFLICLIFSLSLAAIGLGNGVRVYLRQKMDSPFVRFVLVTVPFGYEDSNDYQRDLSSQETRNRYGIEGVTTVHTGYADFRDTTGRPLDAFVSDIHQEDALYKFLTSNPEVMVSDPSANKLFSDANGWGCIVTMNYLKKLGLDKDTPYLRYKFPGFSDNLDIPISICGLVTQLPNFVDVLVSEKLLQAINRKFEEPNPLDITQGTHQQYLRVFVPTEGKDPEEVKQQLASRGYKLEKNYSHVPGIVMEKLGLSNAAQEEQHLRSSLPNLSFIRVYEYGREMRDASPLTIDYLSIAFQDLDSVRAFQDYLLRRHQLKIDMSAIEAADNFRLLEGLISGLSLLLMGFSAVAVILFVSNVVTSYLDKQKRSIGTLKAFGLRDSFILRMFAGISTVLILAGFLVGFLVAHGIGIGVVSLVDLGKGYEQLEFSQWALHWLLLGVVLFPSALIAGVLHLRLRGKSPGDLVYERD